MRRQSYHSADNDSLQADVMRFMAIIAFCLIAILALVRNVDAPPDQEPVAEPEPAILSEPVFEPVPEPVVPEPAIVQRVFVPKPVIEPQPVIAIVEPTPPIEIPTPAPPLDEPVETVVEAVDDSAEEPGLSLRFVSDGDFLRLIAKGDVAVFALRDGQVLVLGRDYEFRRAHPPKQLYEMEPTTIPRLVNEAFARTQPSANGFTWGVSLPRRIASQIQSFIEAVDSGVLLIDRFGDVRHVGTS